MKYVVITGGVVSGLGKGVTASSIGLVLKACGVRVTAIKIDPYINTDAGTMSPFEHGEVFVLDDGGEVDLDLGNYERFLDVTLTKDSNITTGKIYQSVIERERRGDYLGKTVQVVPHITDAIQEWIERVSVLAVEEGEKRGGKEGEEKRRAEVCVIELGGTVGDIESMPFIEALRQFQFRVGFDNFCLVHVSLVPVLGVVGEQKTKPTQHSVRELRALGLTPHLLACRSAEPLADSTKQKLAQFCHVDPNHILNLHDVKNIWHVPILVRDQKAHLAIMKQLNISAPPPSLARWEARAHTWDELTEKVSIAMVGKYTGLSDSYLSVIKALQHASVECLRKLEIVWVASEDLEEQTRIKNPQAHAKAWRDLESCDGILVPGGFGDRGVEGKVLAARYARKGRRDDERGGERGSIPFLGICLGMQIAVIDCARELLGLTDANSTEFDPHSKNPCCIFMPEVSQTHMGGTMRLGRRVTRMRRRGEGPSITERLYKVAQRKFDVSNFVSREKGEEEEKKREPEGEGGVKIEGEEVKAMEIYERHRHRYEVNPTMVERLEGVGLRFVGTDETESRMEVLEIPSPGPSPSLPPSPRTPFFVAVQFHPEFKSRPGKPSPLFLGLVLAASGQLDNFLDSN